MSGALSVWSSQCLELSVMSRALCRQCCGVLSTSSIKLSALPALASHTALAADRSIGLRAQCSSGCRPTIESNVGQSLSQVLTSHRA